MLQRQLFQALDIADVRGKIRFRFVGQDMLLVSAPGEFTDLPFFRVSSRVRGRGSDND